MTCCTRYRCLYNTRTSYHTVCRNAVCLLLFTFERLMEYLSTCQRSSTTAVVRCTRYISHHALVVSYTLVFDVRLIHAYATVLRRKQNNCTNTHWAGGRRHGCGKADAEGGGGVLISMRGRSRMSIDPRVPTRPGRSTSGFYRPGRHCLHQARSAVRRWASRMKGELHLTNEPLLRRVFSHMDDSVNKLI